MSVRIFGVNPTALSRLATGSYTGDGAATQAITGVGFQPIIVIVYAQQHSDPDMATKTDQDGVNAILHTIGVSSIYQADQIISLDADGFTVGDGTPLVLNVLNINLRSYTYVCFG